MIAASRYNRNSPCNTEILLTRLRDAKLTGDCLGTSVGINRSSRANKAFLMRVLLMIIASFVSMGSVASADEIWKNYCTSEKKVSFDDLVLHSEVPPPDMEHIKFTAHSIFAEGFIWSSVCNKSQDYLSFNWPIGGISAQVSKPLNPIGVANDCLCDNRNVDQQTILRGNNFPLYYINNGNVKVTSAFYVSAENYDLKEGMVYPPLRQEMRYVSSENGETDFLFSSHSAVRDGSIANMFAMNDSVSSIVFRVPKNESLYNGRIIRSVLGSLSERSERFSSESFSGGYLGPNEVEALWKVNVEGGKLFFETTNMGNLGVTRLDLILLDAENRVLFAVSPQIYGKY